ncbi:MAG: helix-turn-helix transcriptional regulator, partial [Tepidiformaceae bacterium]
MKISFRNTEGAEEAPRAPDEFDRQVAGVAALGEPVRRALYRYVVAQGKAVSRDEAAEGVGVARHVAKFHLDKLEEDGLLAAEFSRPPGRRAGPGAGRPSKLYRRSSRELAVSLPERQYNFAGRLMAGAITGSERDGVPVAAALRTTSLETGRALGKEAREQAGDEPGEAALFEALRDVLTERGYEPRVDSDGCITLANCPFHSLAQDYTELVCGMNLDLLKGLIEGLKSSELEARLEPAPGRCCVVIGRGGAAGS